VNFDPLTLENPRAKMHVSGNFSRKQDLDLTFTSFGDEKRTGKTAAPRMFQLAGPLDAPVAHMQVAPVTQAKKQE